MTANGTVQGVVTASTERGTTRGERPHNEASQAVADALAPSPELLPQPGVSDLVFLGTGVSRGLPWVTCLTKKPPTCKTCCLATLPGNKNRRRNISTLIRYAHPDGRHRNIVIDIGKEFRQSALEWFPKYGVDRIDAILLTHAHADAMNGLDDLRDWTDIQGFIPVYLRREEMKEIQDRFPYLVASGVIKGSGAVSSLTYHLLDDEQGNLSPVDIEGLMVTPLRVKHGKCPTGDYYSLGFKFGEVLYVSDANDIPPETRAIMEAGWEGGVYVVDALYESFQFVSHWSLEQAIGECRRMRPRLCLAVGMLHELEHEETNARLARELGPEGLRMELAYDGMRLPVAL
eukprot:tig00020553_g10561.t1